jgi:hypothetical protein
MGLERYPPLSETVLLRHSEIMRNAMVESAAEALRPAEAKLRRSEARLRRAKRMLARFRAIFKG